MVVLSCWWILCSCKVSLWLLVNSCVGCRCCWLNVCVCLLRNRRCCVCCVVYRLIWWRLRSWFCWGGWLLVWFMS